MFYIYKDGDAELVTHDSSSASVIGSAVDWIEGTLLGSAATAVAVIAIASVGFLMLAGRIDVRRAAQVIFGCFIVFGASTIANGILGAVSGAGTNADLAEAPPPPPVLPSAPDYPQAATTPYDPYAGAAVAPRR